MAQEFREFISRGNVVDLAVGVIIGAAFGKIVNSLVNDIVMPPIGLLMKGINFSDLFICLNGERCATLAEAKAKSVPVIAYGNFLNTTIEFLIIAACVFAIVKVVNKLKRAEAAAPAAEPPRSEVLLTEIRDLLKK
ncbi:MAG: large conductance mechanosensitive channel protein MscL [Verrucomicrobiaceae bacterium]|nr:MAG: large conductance mechanosensitive channel protein MscL [Verrucomicrobiaceae bacterium]